MVPLSNVTRRQPPFIRLDNGYRSSLVDLLLALTPSLLFGVFRYGWQAVMTIALSLASAMLADVVFQSLKNGRLTAPGLSTAVTAVLLSALMPSAAPLWLPAVGGAVAVLLGRELFGGVGRNPMNPALFSRLLLQLCFPAQMSCYMVSEHPFARFYWRLPEEMVTRDTPLIAVNAGNLEAYSWQQLLTGNVPGMLGASSVLLLMAGGLFLVLRGSNQLRIALPFLAVFSALTVLFPVIAFGSLWLFLVESLLSGGLLIGIFWLSSDPVTSPASNAGKIVFGCGCGLLTVIFRYLGLADEGVWPAILTMNLLSRPIDWLVWKFKKGGR